MTVEATEIGTDNARVIYAQTQQILTDVQRLVAQIETYSGLAEMRASIAAIEETLINLNNDRTSDSVNLSNMADLHMETSAYMRAVDRTTISIQDNISNVLNNVKGTQATLDTFVGWFTPILDDFRNTSIIPTLTRVEGRVEELFESHAAIKTIAEEVYNKAEPLIDRISKSPVLKMLGVGSDD